MTFFALVTLNAPAFRSPTGTVTFRDGASTLATVTLPPPHTGNTVEVPTQSLAALVSFSINTLAVGNHTITAIYGGDGTNSASSTAASITQTILPATTTNLVASTNLTTVGTLLTFTVTVTASGGSGCGCCGGSTTPAGMVTLQDAFGTLATAFLSNGKATFSTSILQGIQAITAVYSGSVTLAGSTSNSLLQTVLPSGTTTTVISSPASSVFGQAVTFTALVSSTGPSFATPHGTVTFQDGDYAVGTGLLDNNGVAYFTTFALPVGSNLITAVYAGDSRFTASTSTVLTQSVLQDSTTTTVSSSSNPAGQAVTFTALVSANLPSWGLPTGTVTFWDGTTNLGPALLQAAGPLATPGAWLMTATLVASSLTAGTNTITAVYSGDSNFTGGTSKSLLQTVLPAGTTTLTSLSQVSVFGQTVIFTATVTGSATGLVTFQDAAGTLGIVSLDSDLATCSTTTLGGGAGLYTVTAVYSGNATYAGSTSNALPETVNQASTTTTLAAANDSWIFGQNVTFTATISPTSPGSGMTTGKVTFQDGSAILGTAWLGSTGLALFTTNNLSVGTHTITAIYGGDNNFTWSGSENTLTQTITQDSTTTTVTSPANPSGSGQAVTFTALVTANVPGSGLPTGTVTFQDGGSPVGTALLQAAGRRAQWPAVGGNRHLHAPFARRRPAHDHGGLRRRRQLYPRHLDNLDADRPGRQFHDAHFLVGRNGLRPDGHLHGYGQRNQPGDRYAHRHGHFPGRRRHLGNPSPQQRPSHFVDQYRRRWCRSRHGQRRLQRRWLLRRQHLGPIDANDNTSRHHDNAHGFRFFCGVRSGRDFHGHSQRQQSRLGYTRQRGDLPGRPILIGVGWLNSNGVALFATKALTVANTPSRQSMAATATSPAAQ